MASRFIIGKGELLTYDIPPPRLPSNKSHPYTLDEAKQSIIPEIKQLISAIQNLPPTACPHDFAVTKLLLHPAYIAKSFFPKALLREAGLVSVGSRTISTAVRRDLRKNAPPICETTELFIAGKRSSFAQLPAFAQQLVEGSPAANDFRQIEHFASMEAVDRIRLANNENPHVFEVGLHQIPDQPFNVLRHAFASFAAICGFTVNAQYEFPVGGMLFLALEGEVSRLPQLAQFTLVRVIRSMPKIRSARPIIRNNSVAVNFQLPVMQPLSTEPTVAILDGGLPVQHPLKPWIRRYEKSDETVADVPDYLGHGLGVTSAFLFGPIEPGGIAARPYAFADHFRVLDAASDKEDPYELYRTLAHIEEVLLSRQYQFINLSLGPDLPVEDSDVHAWTAVLDTLLSDGETLMTVAVGNNGERDDELMLNRIQVPSDSVNALSIGAANFSSILWSRAAYSAKGPGRSPGRRKPDAIAFGGCGKEYFHVVSAGPRPSLNATMGTSFAAPYALRTGVGIRAILGDEVNPLTIKALMIHTSEKNSSGGPDEIGWGRIAQDVLDVIMCSDGVARIIYQGMLRPGKYLRAPIPLPDAPLDGKVKISATFCYASQVDVEDAAAYTRAGLDITFRPHVGKSSGKQIKPRSFFTKAIFRTEQEQRSDLGKWETVLHGSDNFKGSSLNQASFDVHYNARDGAGIAGSGSELIRYALIVTVEAPKHLALHDEILAAHSKLKAIAPKISLPLRT